VGLQTDRCSREKQSFFHKRIVFSEEVRYANGVEEKNDLDEMLIYSDENV
jgi:hypothetical protein